MAYFITDPPRVGRSQGASIFWGLISVCFAAAACYYYWKNHENETTADVMRDQVLQLREENESLNSQKQHLQASKIEAENQMKTREDLIQEKETELAGEELRIEGLGRQSANQSAQNQSQVVMVRKFNDVIKKLGKDTPPDVVERAGRPVLRVKNEQLFATGDATLKPEGKALLTQIDQAILGQMDTFELRVVCYTDTDAEAPPATGAKDPDDPQAHLASWNLTASRATALARYFHDQTQLPFLNVMVSGRGDSEPISPNTGDSHARNRRVEIFVTPLPASFHSPDPDKAAAPATSPAAATPSADSPAPVAKKDKPKDKKPDKPEKAVAH